MNKELCILLASLISSPLTLSAASTAQARLYCLSVHLLEGTDQFGDVFSVNSMPDPSGDGELMIYFSAGPELTLPGAQNYISNMYLYDPFYQQTFGGTLTIDLPQLTDDNNNRYPDFFETAAGVQANSGGSYSTGSIPGSGPIQ